MPLRDHCLRWVLCDQVLPLVSPKDTVSNFTGAVIARAVPSNICVPSARVPTGPLIVIFVPLGSIQVPTPSFVTPVSPLAAGPCLSQNPQRLPTPVNSDRLFFFLSGYDPSIAEVLVKGFTQGFPLHYEGSPSFHASNLLSAIQNPAAVDAKITKELEAHRLAGPFSSPPFLVFRVSPLGLVPKKVKGEFRLIHHFSYPKGGSLNDNIPVEFTSVSYATVEDAIRLIQSVGPGCFLAKTDIKNAFQIVPIQPQDYHLLGICWRVCIIMTAVCLSAVQALAKLLKCFHQLLNGSLKQNCTSRLFYICWMIFCLFLTLRKPVGNNWSYF